MTLGNSNFNPSENNFQDPSQVSLPVCPVCGLFKIHHNCEKQRSQGEAGSYSRTNSTLLEKNVEFSAKAQEGYLRRGKLWQWLDTHGHCRLAHALSSCLSTALQFGCGEHDFYRGDFCGSLLCPICSKKNSYAHQRRKAHFHEKLGWAGTLGKAVFTFPPDLQYLDSEVMFKLVGDFLLTHFNRYFIRGIKGVEVVFHATGKKLTRHPHFEALFGIEDDPEGDIRRQTRDVKKKIPEHRLARLSRHWSAYLKRAYSVRGEPVERKKRYLDQVRVVVSKKNTWVLSTKVVARWKERKWKVRYWFPLLDLPKNVQVHYEYDDTLEKVGHAIKYGSRLAFLSSKQFLSLGDEMKHWLAGLRGKRLIRGFGKFSDRNWRAYVASKPKPPSGTELVEEKVFKMLEGFRCPVDGEKLGFVRRVSWGRGERAGYVECGGIGKAGWWCSQEVYEEVEGRYFNTS